MVGIWQVAGQTVDFGLRARGPVGHYMTYAGQLLLFVSLALGVFICARGRAWRVGSALTALLGSAALLGTFTRSAWLGILVSAAVILGRWKPRWLAALAGVVVLLLLLAPASYRDRMASAFDPTHATNVERTYMWDAGWRMFLDHPMTGVGLQDLHPLYERYRNPAATEATGHLHSVPVHLAATMGVIGLAAFVWLFIGLFRCAGSGLGATLRDGGVAAGVRLGMLGALCGFLVAGLFEWNLGDEELLYPLFVMAGIAWAARGWEDSDA
jgi:O-antigen ligase